MLYDQREALSRVDGARILLPRFQVTKPSILQWKGSCPSAPLVIFHQNGRDVSCRRKEDHAIHQHYGRVSVQMVRGATKRLHHNIPTPTDCFRILILDRDEDSDCKNLAERKTKTQCSSKGKPGSMVGTSTTMAYDGARNQIRHLCTKNGIQILELVCIGQPQFVRTNC